MRTLLNDRWEFVKLHIDSTSEEARQAEWIPVDLPHDWLIAQTDDLYETADAWYRRSLFVEKADDGLCRRLRFDGVYMDCDVLVNGKISCSHAYGYTAFDAELTPFLHEGENEILVHIRHRSPNTRWYSGSGIYRDVELITVPECHFIPDSLYVVSRKENAGWKVTVRTELTGDFYGKELEITLTDLQGELLYTRKQPVTSAKQETTFTTDKVKEWSLEERNLYLLTYAVDGEKEQCRIGFRTTRFDPDEGFFLNGKHVKLNGVCLHHDLGALGAAFHEKAAARQLRIMQEMGVNALRTSHNPPASKLLDLCDEMGILVIDEAFDMWERPKTEFDYARFFPEHEAEDVASWVRRDRNHASVIMWSVGNEIYDLFADDRGREVLRMLKDQVQSHDPEENAKVTFGSNYMPWEGAQKGAEIVKVPGYNYGERLYAEHHATHPDWVIYGSETASILASRGIYHFPADTPIMSEEDLQCSDLGNSNTSWGAKDMRNCIVEDMNIPYSMGQFIWSGIDYIGEPTPYHTRNCYFGQADTACFPKDVYYLFQSLWTEEKMLHIGMRWDWNPGQMIDVRVMSNCASVELFLNGDSLGRKQIVLNDPENCCPMWQVQYVPGTLMAIGYDENDNKILEDRRVTPGDAKKLKLKSEDMTLTADGHDITFIEISAEDENGNPVENANNRIRITVTGAGRLLGLDNGDSTDTDPYQTDSRQLFSGKLLAIVGAAEKEGIVKITAESQNLEPTELILNVIPAEKRMPSTGKINLTTSKQTNEIPIRKIEIIPLDGIEMNPEKKELKFAWKILPEGVNEQNVVWKIVNRNGIVSPCATVVNRTDHILVRAAGDGEIWLRASCNNGREHPVILSHIELKVQNIGQAALNPYEEFSAGLYTFTEGDIGSGNEKGIAFARDGRSMVGYENIDFGPNGTDRLTLPIFALDSDCHEIEMYAGPDKEHMTLVDTLKYHKPSIWNVYQEETYTLSKRLTGIQTIAFAMKEKVHLKSMLFEKQSRAWLPQNAGEADEIYGDNYIIEGTAVKQIGNNVSLTWKNMDFEDHDEAELVIDAQTPLDNNAITIRMKNILGETANSIAIFSGKQRHTQTFRVQTCKTVTDVTIVFLPGSNIDLYSIRFEPQK